MILSAQTTDVRVNEVTPKLFARYRTAADYASADRAELEELIRSTASWAKADSLIGLGRRSSRGTAVGAAARLAAWSPCPASVARPPTWCSATPSAFRASPSTRISGAWSAAGDGRREDDPVKVEHAGSSGRRRRSATGRSCRSEVIFGHWWWSLPALRKPACGACTLAADCPSYGTGPTDPAQAATLVKGPSRERLLRLAGAPDDAPPSDAPVDDPRALDAGADPVEAAADVP